ncbi:hypothetical protein DL765_004754 [Monosporascus sp. GIB2]|nr:hypothetical protein DL765_004754 [Monosporascus sp. GIB2]
MSLFPSSATAVGSEICLQSRDVTEDDIELEAFSGACLRLFGPIIGGAFAFYINLVIGAVSTPVLLVFAPNFRPRPLDVPAVKALQNIDWLGAALSLPAFVLGIMAISFGGTEFPWNAPFIVSSFWAAGVLFFLFWLQQHLLFKTTRATRLFPIHSFAKKNMFLLFIIQGRLTVDTPNVTIYGLQVVLGMGTSAFSQAGFAIAQAMADAKESRMQSPSC